MVKRLPVAMDRGGATVGAYREEHDAVDVATIGRIQAGDNTAYGLLWSRHWPWLCNYFRAQLGNREEAEDLAGATLLAAFEQLDRFRGQTHQLPDRGVERHPTGKPEPESE